MNACVVCGSAEGGRVCRMQTGGTIWSCSLTCEQAWNSWTQEQRLACIFGDAQRGATLMRQIRSGARRIDGLGDTVFIPTWREHGVHQCSENRGPDCEDCPRWVLFVIIYSVLEACRG